MRGEKGVLHPDPEDPPRQRGNQTPGYGTWENDRPPVCGVAGRESGRLRLTVTEHSDRAALERVVMRVTWPMVTVNTDEWPRYSGLPGMGRARPTVCHAAGEWARDDDGGREVHVNTLEGSWTGLRNFLRPFRGVNKQYLYQYVAVFEWGYNVKRATPEFLWALLGVRSATR
jgi:transposase